MQIALSSFKVSKMYLQSQLLSIKLLLLANSNYVTNNILISRFFGFKAMLYLKIIRKISW